MQGTCCDNVFKQNNLYEENQTQPREVFVLQAYRIKKTQKMCSILLTHSMFCHRLEDWDVRLGRLGGRTHGKLNGFEWTRTHSAQIPNESFILQPYMQLHRNVPKLLFSSANLDARHKFDPGCSGMRMFKFVLRLGLRRLRRRAVWYICTYL